MTEFIFIGILIFTVGIVGIVVLLRGRQSEKLKKRLELPPTK